jgi:hypothetical protein
MLWLISLYVVCLFLGSIIEAIRESGGQRHRCEPRVKTAEERYRDAACGVDDWESVKGEY